MPFLQLAIDQTATNHLSSGSGLSSKMVPPLAENFLRGCFSLHSHIFRVAMKRTSVRPHVGQWTPFGQRNATIVSRVRSASAKYRTASMRVRGSCAMTPTYHGGLLSQVYYYR